MKLSTVWGENLDKNNVLPEYPRPQMMRKEFTSLNGIWEYAFSEVSQSDEMPEAFGEILVPFSPESDLSGVGRQLKPHEYLWYRTHINVTKENYDLVSAGRQRLLIHFGAVDQIAVVYFNGHEVMTHTGGFLPFYADIVDAIREGDNELVVRVRDLSDTSYHARGKQKLKRGGMFYTAQSGIWQSVWYEWVPDAHITRLSFKYDPKKSDRLTLSVHTNRQHRHLTDESGEYAGRVSTFSSEDKKYRITVYEPGLYNDDKEFGQPQVDFGSELFPIMSMEQSGDSDFIIKMSKPKLWTCDTPYLYYVDVEYSCDGCTDRVRGYFAMRCFSLEHVSHHFYPRICLNGEPVFQEGVLDQGYYPESLLTPPSDEAMIFDITEMKKTGYNMVRKHIKIEPERWYYHCDRLGIIVWQDMVNGGGPLHQWFVTYLATPLSLMHVRVSDRFYHLLSRTDMEGRREFEREMLLTIKQLKNHPSICTWVIFNEGWGQFHTNEMTELARRADPSRLIDQASGWFDQRGGDFSSIHNYFFKLIVLPEHRRAGVLSEFGGKVLRIEGHTMQEGVYGYGSASKTKEELNETYGKLSDRLRHLIPQGLCATVYTQWTDIEDEINGVYTYDRKVRKIKEGDGIEKEILHWTK